jgi:hypothetical protein
MMKKITLTTTTISLLAAGSFAYADPVTPPIPPDNHRVVVAIEELGNRIEALTKAGVKSVNTLAYQLDKSFTAGMQLNSKQADIQNRTRAAIQIDGDHAVKLSLQPFATNTLTYSNKNQPELKLANNQARMQQNYINQLKNLEASDSIYSLVQGIEISALWTKKNLGAAGRNDDAFNFSAFIEPEAYTPEQAKNSENFIGYTTRLYQNYTDGVNLGQLRTALAQYQKQGPKVLAQQIDQFRNNDTYKKYQMTIRNLTANKSVAVDILNGLAAERKPILTTEADPQLDAISRAIGVEPQSVSLKNADGESVTMFRYASPMQIAKYRANYRLNSPNWYQEVAGDSAENLQRKSVVLLAEISSQLYQNHLDNEKMLGALATSNLQATDLTNQMLQLQVKDVNAAIASFAAGANTSVQPEPLQPQTSSNYDANNPATYPPPPSNYDPNNPATYPSTTGQ